jgi:hypothetical protein
MPGNLPTTNPSPIDIVAKLYVLASASEVGITRPAVASVAREAATEIKRLRRLIEGLQARLGRLCRR